MLWREVIALPVYDEMHGEFNLLDEPWIPVSYADRTSAEVTLPQLLTQAQDILDIGGDIPQQSGAIMLLALASLYRAYADVVGGAPSSVDCFGLWERLWQEGRFDHDVIDPYFDRYHDRFFLCGGPCPFYQVPHLSYADGSHKGLSYLLADLPAEGKQLFFQRSGTGTSRISPAEAARWLVFHQAYDIAGIKVPVAGGDPGAAGKVTAPKAEVGVSTGLLGAMGPVWLQGSNLFQTLMLNWVLYDRNDPVGTPFLGRGDDLAPWELPVPDPHRRVLPAGSIHGPVAAYTWQSRRVRLVGDGACVTGIVTTYGDVTPIYGCVHAIPITAWRRNESLQRKLKAGAAPLTPMQHQGDRALWRGISSLVAREGAGGAVVRPGVMAWLGELQENCDLGAAVAHVGVRGQGMVYGTQASVYKDSIDDSFVMPLSLADPDGDASRLVTSLMTDTDAAVRAVVLYARRLTEGTGGVGKGTRDAVGPAVAARAYSTLDHVFRMRLAGMPNSEAEPYVADWRSEVRGVLLGLSREIEAEISPRHFMSPSPDDGRDTMPPVVARWRLMAALAHVLGPDGATSEANQTEGEEVTHDRF